MVGPESILWIGDFFLSGILSLDGMVYNVDAQQTSHTRLQLQILLPAINVRITKVSYKSRAESAGTSSG